MTTIHTRPGFDAINSHPDVILKGDLVYENDKYIIRVCGGFITDGGSIPRISWTLLGITPYDPRCVYAFFLHDFLYQSELVSRIAADEILDEVLQIPPSCNSVQRFLIWSHVRLYGWLVWKRHTPETIEQGRKMGTVTRKAKLYRSILK